MEKSAQSHLRCPNCQETVLAEDVFCFHCGRRLKSSSKDSAAPSRAVRFPQWPLAILGVAALILAGYVVRHEQSTLSAVQSAPPAHHARTTVPKVLHPVVTTRTTYPASVPSSAHWIPEVATYRNVQFSLRVPKSMDQPLTTGTTSWSWGALNTADRVVVEVVSGKPAAASVSLGAQTWGTPIVHLGNSASQDLYIQWASHQWVAVLMRVPGQDTPWLGSIAESVRVS